MHFAISLKIVIKHGIPHKLTIIQTDLRTIYAKESHETKTDQGKILQFLVMLQGMIPLSNHTPLLGYPLFVEALIPRFYRHIVIALS